MYTCPFLFFGAPRLVGDGIVVADVDLIHHQKLYIRGIIKRLASAAGMA